MENSLNSRYMAHRISDAVNIAGIAAATLDRGDTAHEVAIGLEVVAKQKEPGKYIGQSPNADYLDRVPHMNLGQTPSPRMERLANSSDAIRYTQNNRLGMVPADISMLAGSMYQNNNSASSQPLDSKMFQYQPGGCAGYCGQG